MNYKIALSLFAVSIFLITSVFVIAKPDQSSAPLIIPAHAVQISENVFSLGTSTDVDGRIVEGFAFVDYRKDFGHKPKHNPGGKGGNGGGETSSCFSFLAKDAKWKTVEPYLVDPTNNAGLSTTFIRSNLASDIAQWEDAADGSVDGARGADILGDEDLSGTVNRATIGDLNGQNEVIFADINSEGAIAVTIVWGRFGGPPFARELVEWDQIYDDADFAWSETGESGKMDFWNIAQHELGHSVGIGHPQDECTEETMYAFASFGETKKRSLNAGDIAGVNELY